MTDLLPELDGYEVRRIPAVRAVKRYVCPGCDDAIAQRQGHVVVWPEGLVHERRHWHLHCWRIAARRGRLG